MLLEFIDLYLYPIGQKYIPFLVDF